MTLYSRAAERIAWFCATQLQTLGRHRDCIDRIDDLAKKLREDGFDAQASISMHGSLEIAATADPADLISAISKHKHKGILNQDGTILVLPPESIINGLPVTCRLLN